jgi:Regulator of ribonuclease activity B
MSITKDQLKQMFDNINASTDWDLNKPMLWGYFFIDEDAIKLEKAAEELRVNDYRIVDIREREDTTIWRLHVEKEEIHSVDSLYERNQEFYLFAEKKNLQSYDGMDVGPIESRS